MPPTRLASMTREDATSAAPESILVLPIGATEQHGPHLPVGTDHFTVSAVAEAAAARCQDRAPIVVAPVLPFGHSHHHLPFGGTMSVTPATYQQLLVELGQTAAESGFRRQFILNGHGGNLEIAATAAREISRLSGAAVGSGSYWVMAWEELVGAAAHEGQRMPGHAGAFETSIMLALAPEAVRMPLPERPGPQPSSSPSSFYGPYQSAIPGSWEALDGWTDNPAGASAPDGARYLDVIVAAVAERLVDFHQRTLDI